MACKWLTADDNTFVARIRKLYLQIKTSRVYPVCVTPNTVSSMQYMQHNKDVLKHRLNKRLLIIRWWRLCYFLLGRGRFQKKGVCPIFWWKLSGQPWWVAEKVVPAHRAKCLTRQDHLIRGRWGKGSQGWLFWKAVPEGRPCQLLHNLKWLCWPSRWSHQEW